MGKLSISLVLSGKAVPATVANLLLNIIRAIITVNVCQSVPLVTTMEQIEKQSICKYYYFWLLEQKPFPQIKY